MNKEKVTALIEELLAEGIEDLKDWIEGKFKEHQKRDEAQHELLEKHLAEHEMEHQHAKFEHEDEQKDLKRSLADIEDKIEDLQERSKRRRIDREEGARDQK